MSPEEIEKVVIENAKSLAVVIKVQETTNRDVDKLVKTIEMTVPKSIEVKQLVERVAEQDRKFKVLEPIFIALRYPKITVASLIGLYAFAISDFRSLLKALFV